MSLKPAAHCCSLLCGCWPVALLAHTRCSARQTFSHCRPSTSVCFMQCETWTTNVPGFASPDATPASGTGTRNLEGAPRKLSRAAVLLGATLGQQRQVRRQACRCKPSYLSFYREPITCSLTLNAYGAQLVHIVGELSVVDE